jgi:hypothetical protein
MSKATRLFLGFVGLIVFVLTYWIAGATGYEPCCGYAPESESIGAGLWLSWPYWASSLPFPQRWLRFVVLLACLAALVFHIYFLVGSVHEYWIALVPLVVGCFVGIQCVRSVRELRQALSEA